MRHAIDSRIRQLDGFFARASAIEDDELKADLSKLGAVLACGFVERSVEIIILDRISYRAHPRVQSFVKSYFKKGTNYDCDAICKLIERFDVVWSRNMRQWINNAPAVVQAWYPGMEGGNALAKILFGDVNPSGKLPMTFPKQLEDNGSYKLGEYPGDTAKLQVNYNDDI